MNAVWNLMASSPGAYAKVSIPCCGTLCDGCVCKKSLHKQGSKCIIHTHTQTNLGLWNPLEAVGWKVLAYIYA